MFDRDGCFLRYATEAELFAILKGDRLHLDLGVPFQQAMVVDAASFGWNEAIRYMIDRKGFSPDEHDHKHYTPLGYAAMRGRYKTVAMLIEEYGVDVNARNNAGPHFNGLDWFEGYTALDYALEDNHNHIARLLLQRGAEFGADGKDLLAQVNAELKEQAAVHWAKVRRLAPHVGRIAAFTRALHAYILEPDGPAAKRAKVEFEACSERSVSPSAGL